MSERSPVLVIPNWWQVAVILWCVFSWGVAAGGLIVRWRYGLDMP